MDQEHSDGEPIERARAQLGRSYAPYSKFKTAAAVVTDRGDVVTGVLVENVSLGTAI